MNESKFSPVFNLQGAPHLARDSRGSLEVFNPDRLSQQRPEKKEEQSFLQIPEFPKEHTPRSVLNTLDLEVGSSWRLHEFSHASHPGKQPENPSDEHHAAPENTAVYDRATEWGQVLKSDSTTVAGVRGSGDSAGNWRASAASSSDMGENPHIPRVSEDLKDALSSFQQTFVVCDALMQDFPILYASAGFFNMTGYTAKEVIGRNCRFLQGAETDPADVAKIREALQQSKSFCGRLLNYKKDGTPFWNLLTIAPIKDEDGNLLKYIGMLVEVSQFTEGTKDKAVRPNGMPESLIKYDARQKEKVVSSVSELVEAFKENRKSSTDGRRASVGKLSNVPESSPSRTMKKTRRSSSFLSFLRSHEKASPKVDTPLKSSDEFLETIADLKRKKEIRRGIDLATTLERIEKNFVITDPRLPDNPIIFASDSFLELTEYSREEIIGRNCRFLQGPDTDRDTVQEIRDAIREQRSITVQLLNYTKRGKPFWNLFHLQPMRDHKGELQYFIGVQLDGSQHFDNVRKGLPERIEQDGVQVIHSTAGNVDTAVRELPDANQDIHELWSKYSKLVRPKPHKVNTASWAAINKVLKTDGYLSLKHFRPVKCLGSGDTGGVHLVELLETGHYFAMKAMEKSIMLNRNKVHRTLMERDILDMMDHPFLPTLYGSFETESHICLITDFCPGGELFVLLDMQPSKIFNENAVRFYAAEVVIALEYLHCKGVVYRDLKPENILLQRNGHLLLTDFDLSFMSFSRAELVTPVRSSEGKKKKKKPKEEPLAPKLVAKPLTRSNSFVGTEEYIAPEVIKGNGHSTAVDWWALGILLYEMLYGYTPFRGKNRQKTFRNILNKELTFPNSVQVSLAAKQLISGLLEKDPSVRLGSSTGANELREHRFFYGVYWPLIRCQRTPDLASPISLINETATEEEAFSVF